MTPTNQVQVKQEVKKLHCFTCGKEIKFAGFGSRTRLNVDGSIHVCNQTDKEAYGGNGHSSSRSKYSRYQRRNRWYWGYGPGAYHKRNQKRYSSQDYESRRKAAEEAYKQYRERYSRREAYESQATKLDDAKALEILGLTKEVLTLQFKEKVQAIKDAFRKLALRFHPDRKPEGNAAKFIQVFAAYEVLMIRHNGGSK